MKRKDNALLKASYVEAAETYYHSLKINNGRKPVPIHQKELRKWKYPSEIKIKNDKVNYKILKKKGWFTIKLFIIADQPFYKDCKNYGIIR